MKKYLFSITCLFLTWTAFAQYDQGKSLISGGISFSTMAEKYKEKSGGRIETEEGDRISTVNLGVSGGYFINDNFAIGLGLGLESEKEAWEGTSSEGSEITRLFTVAPFVRFYKPYNDKLSFYSELAAGLGFGKFIDEYKSGASKITDEFKYNTSKIGFTPGLSYLLSQKMALEMRVGFIGYKSFSIKNEGTGDDYVKYSTPEFVFSADLNTIEFVVTFIL